jgi:hypothetical protein
MMHWESFGMGVLTGAALIAFASSLILWNRDQHLWSSRGTPWQSSGHPADSSDQPSEDSSPIVPFSEQKRMGKTMWDNVHRRKGQS